MLDYFKEQFSNLEKTLYLSKIDLVKTYRGSSLGWFWAIFRPAFTIFVYYFTFTIGLRASKDMFGYPYFLWLIAGVIPWFFIRDIFQQGTECIRKYDYLVTKVKFPVSIIPTFSTISNLFIHLVLMIIFLAIYLISTHGFSLYILQLPVYMFFMLVFFVFLCLLLSSISAISKDFCSLIKSFTFAVFWLSGVIWDIAKLDITWLKYLLYLNPVTFIVNGYRNCFIKHIWFWNEPLQLICFLVELVIVMALSIFIYNRLRKDMPDLL